MRLLMALIVAGLGYAAAAAPVPLLRPRPSIWVEPRSFAEAAAGLHLDSAAITDQPTDCDKRLSAVAEAEPLPRLIGPQACGGGDMVELHAVLMPDKSRVAVTPAAVLTCAMAESLAAWLREEAAPDVAKLGSALVSIENYDSYECRSRNRMPGAKLSEHAHGDALDIRALRLADGRRLELTDPHVDKPLREALRDSACRRFMTVLGPGDPFHESHIHVDVIDRHSGYRICQWEVRAPPSVPLPRPRPPQAGLAVNHPHKL